MFKNSYQNGLLSIFYSCGSNPLGIWDAEVQNGHIKRLTDNDVNSIVLEIASTNVATTYIACPKKHQVLGIKLPFLVMIIKNLKRYFSFEITILDDKNMRRRFRISNFQSTTKIKPFCTYMPIGLSGGWNQIQFNLADFTRRAYGSTFMETLRVQIHANVRLRRIYFCDRLYTEDELPQDYKLFLPMEHKQKKGKVGKKESSTVTKISRPIPVATENDIQEVRSKTSVGVMKNVSINTSVPMAIVTEVIQEDDIPVPESQTEGERVSGESQVQDPTLNAELQEEELKDDENISMKIESIQEENVSEKDAQSAPQEAED